MKLWVLYAYYDEDNDAPVLESFSEEEGKPKLSYILEAFGTGTALVEYDIVEGKLVNPVMVSPRK
jgi:hypothetical protein